MYSADSGGPTAPAAEPPPAEAQPVEAPQVQPPSLDAQLALRPRTDLGNSERLISRYGADLRHASGRWFVYDGTRFAPDELDRVRYLAQRSVRAIRQEAAALSGGDQNEHLRWADVSESARSIAAAYSLAGSHPSVACSQADFDVDPWLLNCSNGTIDLRTGTLRPHRREDLLSKVCQTAYVPDAPRPLWDSTLELVFPNPAIRDYWQRVCGAALVGQVRDHKLIIAYGEGSNGKSTVLTAIIRALGKNYGWQAPSDFLSASYGAQHPTTTASLHGKRIVVANEPDEARRLDESKIKALTGGDEVTARRMREDSWSFTPSHHLILAANHKPTVRGTDHGIWRRLVLVPFTTTIPTSEARTDMLDLLAAEHEGILAWAVEGCLEWIQRGLAEPAEVLEATAEYRREQDVIRTFLEMATVPVAAPEGRLPTGAKGITTSELHAAYCEWARSTREPDLGLIAFGRKLSGRLKVDRSSGRSVCPLAFSEAGWGFYAKTRTRIH